MNKRIKIIEILDNYADDKKILMPKYVKYFDRIYKTDYIMLVCQENIIDKLDKNAIKLTDEVEILEDNTEEIEELPDYNYSIKENRDKINELVRAVNQIILDNSEED